ncbi:hypothetical protein H0E87_007375 [Populus deltoides]|uniref:Mediator of RNA polymerase II transcription subunit 9 n=1 Tax=Populus deltoides TaxID=3696 RepID=A0A8T2ZA96_POPDE|nr:hypothetical protein H0E87_007375 [Populus deltoides]
MELPPPMTKLRVVYGELTFHQYESTSSFVSLAASSSLKESRIRRLAENLADAIENGTRDQHSDALVNELNTHFDKCQQLLNSISSSINAKAMTVEGQKRKLEESEQLLNQRRELIGKYRNSVEELLKSEP